MYLCILITRSCSGGSQIRFLRDASLHVRYIEEIKTPNSVTEKSNLEFFPYLLFLDCSR